MRRAQAAADTATGSTHDSMNDAAVVVESVMIYVCYVEPRSAVFRHCYRVAIITQPFLGHIDTVGHSRSHYRDSRSQYITHVKSCVLRDP